MIYKSQITLIWQLIEILFLDQIIRQKNNLKFLESINNVEEKTVVPANLLKKIK